MKLKSLLVTAVVGVGILSAYCADVSVSAAVSLKECLNEIIANYQSAAPGVKIIPNYDASGKLQMQIENGAPVDLFISANQDKMDLLENKGLLQKGSRTDLLENKVVLIVPLSSALKVTSFKDLALAEFKEKSIAIGDPQVVPAGKYALEILQKLGIESVVKPKLVYAQNVRAVLTYVAQNEVAAGIIYETDGVLFKDKVKIAAYAPAGSHTPVVYPAAVVTTGKAAKDGAAFLAYLKTPAATEIFKKYGFGTIR